MKLFARLRGDRYCAYCKSPRSVYLKKHIDLTNVLLTLALAVTASTVIFGWMDPRAIGIWSILLVGTETFIFLRWRFNLECRLCGFDPIVYKRNPTEAAQRVATFFSENTKTSKFFLSKSPLLDVYKDLQKKQRKQREYDWVKNKNEVKTKPVHETAVVPKKGSQVSKSI